VSTVTVSSETVLSVRTGSGSHGEHVTFAGAAIGLAVKGVLKAHGIGLLGHEYKYLAANLTCSRITCGLSL